MCSGGGRGVHTAALCSLQSPMVMQLKTIMKQKNRAAWVQESQKKKMALSKEMFLPVTVSRLEPDTQSCMLNYLPSPSLVCVCAVCVCVCVCVCVRCVCVVCVCVCVCVCVRCVCVCVCVLCVCVLCVAYEPEEAGSSVLMVSRLSR